MAQKTKTGQKGERVKQKLRIKIRAYDHQLADQSAKKIIEAALRYGAEVAGPIPLPTEVHKFTTNRATFVHKDARDQFEMRIHKRVVDIYEPSHKIVDALSNLDLPSGANVEIKY